MESRGSLDIWFMPAWWTLEMQCLGLADFEALIDQNAFQPPDTPASSVSHTTTLLLTFHIEADLKDIGHVNIGLIVHCQGCNFYEQDAIHGYMGSIRTGLVVTKKYRVVGCKLPVQSYVLLVGNFGGRIAVPTNPPYCLMYVNTYSSTVPLLEWTPFNTAGSPPDLHLGKCMCCTLLQVADLSMERKWQYAGSHLIIPHGTQFTNRFPTIVEPHNHSLLIRNAEGVPYPMEAVGDFALEDKIFPGILGDSLLFDGTKLMRPWQKNYSVLTHLPPVSHQASGGMSSHSTFESDAEAPSKGITPQVTSPHCPPPRSCNGTTVPRGKLSLRRKMRPSTRTRPHAKTLTAPPPRGPMVVKVGSMAQARKALCLH